MIKILIADDEKKIKLFERANSLRLSCEFDRAYGVFESIIEDEDSWMNFDNDDSIDLTAKTWADNVYKSYEQNI